MTTKGNTKCNPRINTKPLNRALTALIESADTPTALEPIVAAYGALSDEPRAIRAIRALFATLTEFEFGFGQKLTENSLAALTAAQKWCIATLGAIRRESQTNEIRALMSRAQRGDDAFMMGNVMHVKDNHATNL